MEDLRFHEDRTDPARIELLAASQSKDRLLPRKNVPPHAEMLIDVWREGPEPRRHEDWLSRGIEGLR